MLKAAPIALAALMLGAPLHAQDRTAEVDSIFSFATPETPGCVAGVSQHGRVVVNRAYGLADVDRRVPLNSSSVLDIGSTQKQFVAAAILLLAEEGRLSLSDDVRRHIPELPDYGRTITLDHMLTHTSGLRDWIGMRGMSGGDPEVMPLILRQQGLNFTPGDAFSYSNTGFVLLKEIVARVSGRPFADFARERLFEPLGMTSTSFVPDMLQDVEKAALGYQKTDDGWKQYMLLGNARGDGAIASTAGDLLTWNEALTSGQLGAAVTERLQEQARLNNGRTINYARGLIVEPHRGGRMVWHSGGAAGYSAWMGRMPAHGLSVAVLCNFDPVSATELAHRVADLFLPTAAKATMAPTGAAGAPDVDVTARAGLFFNEGTGEILRLVPSNGQLRIPGLRHALVAVTEDHFRNPSGDLFFRSQDEFEIRFTSPDEFQLASLDGVTTVWRRARPYTPAAADAEAYRGLYRSDDLDSSFEVRTAPGGVVLHRVGSGGQGSVFKGFARDSFIMSLMTVRFRRDDAGQVLGFELSSPAVRGLWVPRVADAASDGAQ